MSDVIIDGVLPFATELIGIFSFLFASPLAGLLYFYLFLMAIFFTGKVLVRSRGS